MSCCSKWTLLATFASATFLIGASAFSLSPASSQRVLGFDSNAESTFNTRYGGRARVVVAKSGGDSDTEVSALPAASLLESPSSDAPTPAAIPGSNDNMDSNDSNNDIASTAPEPAAAALFINQQTKRILIEDLKYKRAEVERLRPELAGPIVAKRMSRPAEGVPDDWLIADDQTSNAMLERLENESRYPLKFPLLVVSLVLFGKGFGDAAITLIKVNIDFPGASLTEEFMGLPLLGIDTVCVVAGAALASWTWKTMKN